jgi:hypothetical protein
MLAAKPTPNQSLQPTLDPAGARLLPSNHQRQAQLNVGVRLHSA